MRVPPSQSLTIWARAGERLLAALEPHRARHPREAGPEREHLDPLACLGQCVGEAQIVLGAGFHRAGDVDEQQHLARPHPALESRELEELAVVARRIPQRAAQVDHGAAPRAQTPVAQTLRQAPPSLAGQAPQSFARVGWAEAALDQGLGASRGLAGFVRLVGGDRLVRAAPIFLNANHILVVAVGKVRRRLAEEMQVEQSMIDGVTLGRGSERR